MMPWILLTKTERLAETAGDRVGGVGSSPAIKIYSVFHKEKLHVKDMVRRAYDSKDYKKHIVVPYVNINFKLNKNFNHPADKNQEKLYCTKSIFLKGRFSCGYRRGNRGE